MLKIIKQRKEKVRHNAMFLHNTLCGTKNTAASMTIDLQKYEIFFLGVGVYWDSSQ